MKIDLGDARDISPVSELSGNSQIAQNVGAYGEGGQGPGYGCDTAGRCRMQPRYAYVFLSGSLLRFDQARRSFDADHKVARHLGIQGATMACLLDTQDTTNPCHYLVRGRVGGLVQIDNSISNVQLQRPLERRVPARDWRVVAGSDVEFVVVFQEKRPARGIKLRSDLLGLDHKLSWRFTVCLGLLLCRLAHQEPACKADIKLCMLSPAEDPDTVPLAVLRQLELPQPGY